MVPEKSLSSSNGTLISVIIPVHMRVDLLRRSVSSVLSQTHRNFEVLVIDDGSPEDVKEALSVFDDPRLIYLRREQDQGISAARNRGIEQSKGEYVAFLDSDDEWKETKLEAQLSRLRIKGPSYQACYTERKEIDDVTGKVIEKTIFDKEGEILEHILFRSRFLMSSFVVSRQLLLDVGGFDERISIGEDWELYLRLAPRTLFAYVSEPLTIYHFHEDQITKTFDGNKAYVESLRIILKKHEDLYRKNRKAWSSLLNRIGYYQMTCGQRKAARNSFLHSVIHYPFQKAGYASLARMIKGWK